MYKMADILRIHVPKKLIYRVRRVSLHDFIKLTSVLEILHIKIVTKHLKESDKSSVVNYEGVMFIDLRFSKVLEVQ